MLNGRQTGLAASVVLFALLFTSEASAEFHMPYFYVDGQTDATLELVNNSPEDAVATISARLYGRITVDLGAVELPSGVLKRVSLRERLGIPGNDESVVSGAWGDGSRIGSLWGSLRIQCDSDHFSGWVISRSVQKSLSVNSMLVRPETQANTLRSHWYRPTPGTKAFFVIQNVGDVDMSPSARVGDSVLTLPSLGPGQSSLVSLSDLPGLSDPSVVPSFGVVEFETTSSALALATVLYDESVGFSTILGAHNPETRVGNTLESPGFPLGRPDPSAGFPIETVFDPKLVVSNHGDDPMTVKIYLKGRNPDFDPGAAADLVLNESPYRLLPQDDPNDFELELITDWSSRPVASLTLAPGETALRGLAGWAADSGLQTMTAGLRLACATGRAGDLTADLVVVDQTLKYSFYDPMHDVAIERHNQVAISFSLEQSSNTSLLINNTDNAGGFASIRIRYQGPGGRLTQHVTHRMLGPGEIATLDLKQLRDERVPDDNGALLPIDLQRGCVQIRTSPRVISGDPTFDVVHGTCYSCPDYCALCTGYSTQVIFLNIGCDGLSMADEFTGQTPCGCVTRFFGTSLPYSAYFKVGYEVEQCFPLPAQCYPVGAPRICF